MQGTLRNSNYCYCLERIKGKRGLMAT